MSTVERSAAGESRQRRQLKQQALATGQTAGIVALSGGGMILAWIGSMSTEMRAGIIGAFAMIVCTAWTIYANRPTPPPPPPPPTELVVVEASLRATIEKWRDGSTDPTPAPEERTGMPGSNSFLPRKVNDWTTYVYAYEIEGHNNTHFPLRFHTSGAGKLHSVYPPDTTREEDLDECNRSHGSILTKQIDLRKADGTFHKLVVALAESVNGLQRPADGGKYESDIGFHVNFVTRRARIVVDFSSIDHHNLLVNDPKVYLVTKKGPPELVPSAFTNGILRAEYNDPPLDSTLWCDWEWATEKSATESRPEEAP